MLPVYCIATWIAAVTSTTNGLQCSSEEFLCEDGSECIEVGYFCDGIPDCRDASDEPLWNNSTNPENETFCRGKVWGEICILRADLAPSLERHWEKVDDGNLCEVDEFSCADGSECISEIFFCDNYPHCRDRSDEPPLRNISIKYNANQTFWRGREGHICVLNSNLAPSLERYCEESRGHQCTSGEFPCADGSRCIPATRLCDEYRDCRDGSDEILRNISTEYEANQTFCRGHRSNICVVRSDVAQTLGSHCREGRRCESGEVLCADGSQCISAVDFCDRRRGCRDGSDEILRNISSEYEENQTFCRGQHSDICVVRSDVVKSLGSHCREWRRCQSGEFLCADGSQCISAVDFCDRHRDCRDGSDEILRYISVKHEANETACRGYSSNICMASSYSAKSLGNKCHEWKQCGSHELLCADGSQCVHGQDFCNGRRDCRDGSDERPLRITSINYDTNVTFCRGNVGHVCVLTADIAPSLERYCKKTYDGHSCESDEFSCDNGSRCIPGDWFCDGHSHCGDKSDEIYWNINVEYSENETFCVRKRHKYFGTRNICVLRADVASNLGKYCEKGQRCRSDEFSCMDGSQCIKGNKFCDQYPDCRDKSDEPPLRNMSNKYEANVISCKGKHGRICVLPTDLVPPYSANCKAASEHQCNSYEFSCADGSQCIAAYEFCSGYSSCRDKSDEPPLRHKNIKYDGNETFCRAKSGRICVLRADLVPPHSEVCRSVSDHGCESDEFPCADWSQCIPGNKFCDGTSDCRDGSDELRANDKNYQYISSTKSCQNIHSGTICTLPTGVDLRKLEFCKLHFLGKYRFGCLSNPSVTILNSNLCNGVFDCPDLSDECLCSHFQQERCQHSKLRDVMMTSSLQESFRYMQCPEENKAALKCDGVPECDYFWEEECNCTVIPEFCTQFHGHFHNPEASCIYAYDDYDDYAGGNGDEYYNYDDDVFGYFNYEARGRFPYGTIYGYRICDGVGNCLNDTDERSCEASRFYCTDDPLPNIPIDQICDGDEDCPNGADEKSNGIRFCCNDDGSLKYISQPMVCDGIQDCRSGSDECQNCIVSAFSNDSSLISSKALLAFVFIISTVALLGCLAVLAITVRDLIAPKRSHDKNNLDGHTKLIKILILSLSNSDMLVAVYTLIICIKAVEFNNDYCLMDRKWRSSSTCSALGAILMIGSEQSVFTMVMIALQRLYTIIRPFARPNILCASAALIVSWLISIILGIVPLIPQLEDYFVSTIMFNENQIFRMMYHNDTGYMIDWLSLMHQNSTIGDQFGVTEWSKIRRLTAEINPNISVNYEFGYYSSHTVCLPTFFPDPVKDKAWGYTLFVLLINFFAFLFMAVCYIIFYRQASKSKFEEQSGEQRKKPDQQNAKLQRKLTRIVATDFLCWMPICIMGFLQISGVIIHKDVYLPTGLIIAPINSALNPLLYSDLPEILMNKLRPRKQQITQHTENPTEFIEMT